MFIYFWEREREREWGKGRARGRHRIWSRLQALSCQHRARHGAQTHTLWDGDLSRSQMLNYLTNWATQAPPCSSSFLTWRVTQRKQSTVSTSNVGNGKSICKWHIWLRSYYPEYIRNWYNSTPKKAKNPMKNGQKTRTGIFSNRHPDGQQTHEKMLNITPHQGNANQNHNEISPRACQNG